MEKNNLKEKALILIERAKENLIEMSVLLEGDLYFGAVNRCYYAIFHAISALLILEDKQFSSHKSLISYFGKQRLFQSFGVYHYDIAPVSSTSQESLDKKKLKEYFTKYRSIKLVDLQPQEVKNLLTNSDILKQPVQTRPGQRCSQ